MTSFDSETLLRLTDMNVSDLLAVNKRICEPPIWLDSQVTGRGRAYDVEGYGASEAYEFILDVENKSVGVVRNWTFQLRYAHNIILARLDVGKFLKHFNATNGAWIKGTRLHIWKHAKGDTHADEVAQTSLAGVDDDSVNQCLRRFLGFCTIDVCDIDPSIFVEGS